MTLVSGRYELSALVGNGGQGYLYRGRDERTGETVAVKRFKVHDLESTARRRYATEVKVLSTLPANPHVVAIRDTCEHDGDLYVIMEWLDGSSLDRVLKQTRPRLEQIQRWSREICLALAHCHRNGVVHRDVKPPNIMITSAGAVLVDFGIVRVEGSTVTEGPPIGSLAYMAPERWQGQSGEAPTDLYSFGCVLYEMLTKQPPFGQADQYASPALLMDQHLRIPAVPPAQRVEGVPQAFDRLTMKLLAKLPHHRPSSAMEVVATLAEVLHPRTGAQTDEPFVDPSFVAEMRSLDDEVQRMTAAYGAEDERALEAGTRLAVLIAGSGDTTGAIREYDRLIATYDRLYGPFDERSLQLRDARNRLTLGHH